ncbi:MAG: YegS/Rv2252/BmrU family lipid kinase [Bacteroidetes bacterium]|nr:YegS/Rv2252/BmrU family lipid kinase [Bacteroidota bacterium]
MGDRSALFIVNKFSGGSYRPETELLIREQCKKADIDCRIEFTQKIGHATDLARLAVEQKINLVFAVGGDGTVNETAQGLYGSTVAMGILPKGSGNGLARHLGMPMSIKKSVEIIRKHREVLIDVVKINQILSVNVSGIGFDGHVANLFAAGTQRGLVGYTKLVFSEFKKFKPFEASIKLNDKTFEVNPFIIALANASQFGNNACVAPQASLCDGLMDVCVIRKIPLAHLVGFGRKLFTHKLDRSRFVDFYKAKQVSVELNTPVAFHVDGEPMASSKKFDIELKPASLKILSPSESII